MDLSSAQLTSLRTRPHRSGVKLSIFRPRVVLEAQIPPGVKIGKSERDLPITVLSGNVLDAIGGMTVYIGTTQGSKDLGRVRLRSTTANTMKVAENSTNWIAGWFLTIVRYFEPWGVFPRIELVDLDGDGTATDPIFYKDWDIVYTNQNQEMDPVVNMGPNHAGMLTLGSTPTGSHRVWYTSSGSFNPTIGAAAIQAGSASWHFEGGDPTGSTLFDPGYVNYTGCGHYVTSLTLTSSEGPSLTGRRHVSILARPENPGSCKPINQWGLNSLEGDRETGGWAADIWVREPANPEDIVEGALVVLFTEDFEGGVETKIGANAENRGSILFVGHIASDSILYDPQTSKVSFEVLGLGLKMAELSTFSTALDSKTTASTWTDMREMTVDRAMTHFLRWHSTILETHDYSDTGDIKPVEFMNYSRGNLRDSVQSLLGSTLVAASVSDRQGKLWNEIDARVQPTGTARQIDGHMQSVINLTRQDWRRELAIDRAPESELAYLEMGGLAYSSQTTGTFDAFLSGAPGFAPDYYGSTERTSGLVVSSQAQLNQLSGLAWAAANPLYPTITVPLAGDYRFLDIAPQHRVEITLEADDTFRRIVFDQKAFIPNTMSYEYRPSDQILLQDMEVVEETEGGPGETIIIPVHPPYDGGIPPINGPIIPPIIIPPPPDPPPDDIPPGPGEVLYMFGGSKIIRCTNVNTGRVTGSTWEDLSPTFIDDGVTGSFQMFRLDPTAPASVGFLLTNVTTGPGIHGPYLYRINDLGLAPGLQTYVEILNPVIWAEEIDENPGQTRGHDFTVSSLNQNIIYVDGREAAIGGDIAIIRTLNGGLEWDGLFIPGQDQNDNEFIQAGVRGLDEIWILADINRRIYKSNNFGNTFQIVLNNSGTRITQLEIPVHANPLGDVQYLTDLGQTVRFTQDQWVTELDISPVFAGTTWFLPSVGGQSTPRRPNLLTHPLNRLNVIMMGSPVSGGGDKQWFYSTDGGITWLPGRAFPTDGGNNVILPLAWHPTNPNMIAFTQNGGTDHF